MHGTGQGRCHCCCMSPILALPHANKGWVHSLCCLGPAHCRLPSLGLDKPLITEDGGGRRDLQSHLHTGHRPCWASSQTDTHPASAWRLQHSPTRTGLAEAYIAAGALASLPFWHPMWETWLLTLLVHIHPWNCIRGNPTSAAETASSQGGEDISHQVLVQHLARVSGLEYLQWKVSLCW